MSDAGEAEEEEEEEVRPPNEFMVRPWSWREREKSATIS